MRLKRSLECSLVARDAHRLGSLIRNLLMKSARRPKLAIFASHLTKGLRIRQFKQRWRVADGILVSSVLVCIDLSQ